MKEWIIAGWLHLGVGIAIGWILFARPAWATALWVKVKAKIGL